MCAKAGADATPLSRDDLLRSCLRGDDAAWRLFLERYGDLIYSVALRTGASHSDAEEVFQNAVLAIYESIGRLKDPEKIVPWIAGLTRRQALFYFRKRSREVAEPADGLPESADPAPLPEEALTSLERGQILRDALGDLRARCRDLLTSLYLADPAPSYDEVAERLGIPVGSIGPTRARCLEGLRVALETRRWDNGD